MILDSVDALIKFHEGFVATAQPDAKGKWEYGYGFDIPASKPGEPIPTITREEADLRFPEYRDIAAKRAIADLGQDAWDKLDTARQAVLVDIAYEIGGKGLAGFVRFLAAIRAHNWFSARAELIASRLYDQVPQREAMNCEVIRTGAWPAV